MSYPGARLLNDRLIQLRQLPDFDNFQTRVGADLAERPLAPEVAFLAHYDRIAAALRAVHAPALAVFAFDDEGLAAAAVLPARPDRVEVASVGRHAHADLALQGDPQLALRHLALIVQPHTPGSALRWRAIDLRTGAGMLDEVGRPLPGFEADGTAFFHVSRYTVLAFARADQPIALPPDPGAAWRALPKRTWAPDPPLRRSLAARWTRSAPAPARDSTTTAVQVIRAPSYAGERGGGRQVGVLHLTCAGRTARLAVDEGAARAGVLIGRYDRCDHHGVRVLTDTHVSRVHALLVRVGDQTVLMDAGSTNGLWHDGARVPVVRLGADTQVELGLNAATLRWASR